jgi:N-dimethylarginine dimethylaminohydrolase
MLNVRGERWFPDEATFADQMEEHWGDWFCDSEIGRLHAVLMRRPGAEIDGVTAENYADVRWNAPMNQEQARKEHDSLADIYREHGIAVHYIDEQRVDRPNALYVRDQVFMTPEGAIVCRLGISARRGEERGVARQLAELGVPIVRTINGDGIFDGACAMWVDPTTVILGSGARANASGLAQVEHELRNQGVTDFIRFQIPYGHAHIDGLLNIADRDKAVLFPWQVPYDVVAPLRDRGFDIIEADDPDEVKEKFACNFVALEPGKVVAPAGADKTHAKMRDAGIEVITVGLDQIMNGWGAVHCMTAFLKRDAVDA